MEAILVVVALVVMSTSVFDFLHPPPLQLYVCGGLGKEKRGNGL